MLAQITKNDLQSQLDTPEPLEYEDKTNTLLEIDQHLSFNALKGANGTGTMRFTGQVNRVDVQVLLDSGNNDNFVHPRLAQFLNLPIALTPQFEVLVGNSSTLTTEGCIKDLQLKGFAIDDPRVQSSTISVLVTSGGSIFDSWSFLASYTRSRGGRFCASTLKFYLNGKFNVIQGNICNAPSQAQFHHFRRLMHIDTLAECYTILCNQQECTINQNFELTHDMTPDLAQLLQQYKVVFNKP